ncbi:GrpB family protein [Salimicrobium sp. PL1-032A]|uniref:GrpB family protein n=1 Tax=Salimicrobium sp. PL1-032A TaxID=3095364 RepID=UPI0032605BD1
MRQVNVVTYNEAWPKQFESEARSIQAAMNHTPAFIHHIGSTSVPELPAKPIIDMMPIVAHIDEVDHYNDAMKHLGYEAMGTYGIEGRRFFRKGGDSRTHHVHVFEAGSPEAERHLAFRDYLINRPDVAFSYGTLKRGLAEIYPEDMEAYISGKAEWIQRTEAEAIRWYREERLR